MIFPEDFKLVGVKDRRRQGDPIYFSTSYLISLDGPELYSVSSRGQGFIRDVKTLELLAAKDQIVIYPEVVDTRNRARLIRLADEASLGRVNTVIFKGPDEHMTFVHKPDPSRILTIEVLDAAPPDPPWLARVLKELESCGLFGDLEVEFVPRVIDLRDFESPEVYYPCHASGLGRSLDSDKVVHTRPKIVGCEVSREIFLELNPGLEHQFVNICPSQSLMPERPFISRCCRSERKGLTSRNGQTGVLVHWGDGPNEIQEAVRCLVRAVRK
jgi:hypothetical protein